jgi:hypothetical protein
VQPKGVEGEGQDGTGTPLEVAVVEAEQVVEINLTVVAA